jgi:ribosome-associated toxin RatA of RatAB toxin-antitoxin module
MMIVLYIVIGLVALLLILPAFMPKTYSIEKTIMVNSSPDVCYDKVADLNHYSAWNPWSQMEPTASKKIEGSPKTVGHKYHWEGKKIGKGTLSVKNLDPGKSAKIDLEFIKPWKALSEDDWKFETIGNQTKITWKNRGPLIYPIARLMGPMINKNLSKQFEQGLVNLKNLCEK